MAAAARVTIVFIRPEALLLMQAIRGDLETGIHTKSPCGPGHLCPKVPTLFKLPALRQADYTFNAHGRRVEIKACYKCICQQFNLTLRDIVRYEQGV